MLILLASGAELLDSTSSINHGYWPCILPLENTCFMDAALTVGPMTYSNKTIRQLDLKLQPLIEQSPDVQISMIADTDADVPRHASD
jgi:hypothetical protein